MPTYPAGLVSSVPWARCSCCQESAPLVCQVTLLCLSSHRRLHDGFSPVQMCILASLLSSQRPPKSAAVFVIVFDSNTSNASPHTLAEFHSPPAHRPTVFQLPHRGTDKMDCANCFFIFPARTPACATWQYRFGSLYFTCFDQCLPE